MQNLCYNASPPPDDGTQVAANLLEWQKHLDKIGAPLKTAIEAINTNVSSAFDDTVDTSADTDNTIQGAFSFTSAEITIASGSATPTRKNHSIDTESDAAADDLDTLSTASLADGAEIILKAESAARVVTVKDGTGNINLADNADFILNSADKRICLQRTGANWVELYRSGVGGIVQVTKTQVNALQTSTTAIPIDNTLPQQSTEGTSIMTQSITPTSSTNRLLIEVHLANINRAATNTEVVVALFQDSTEDALAASAITLSNPSEVGGTLSLVHEMAAGTTSATTFKVHLGPDSGSNAVYCNSQGAGLSAFGGGSRSHLRITELIA